MLNNDASSVAGLVLDVVSNKPAQHSQNTKDRMKGSTR